MADLSGVRVVVTGATSGIGEAMADALLESGATVAFAARESERLHASVVRRQDEGFAAQALALDVRDAASVEAAADRAFSQLGGIDLVINNAGIGMRTVNPRFSEEPMSFFEVSPEGFSDVIATNLTGYFLVAAAFARRFVEVGHGAFVNVSMGYGTMNRRGFVPYGPSRAGSEALSLIMTEDLRPYDIPVNIVLPGGATDTGMIPQDAPRRDLLPAQVMGPPAVFLASPEAGGLTGARIIAREFDQWLAAFRLERSSSAK